MTLNFILWLDKTEKIINDFGGIVNTRIIGKQSNVEAILFGFTLNGDTFKILWPVLPTKNEKDKQAALRQCATLIYHDTKARAVRLKIFSPRVVFSDYLILENGKCLAEINTKEIPSNLKLLM